MKSFKGPILTALFIALVFGCINAIASFPTTLDPTRPLGTELLSLGDDQIRALKQFLSDEFGIPVDPTSITGPILSVNENGYIKNNYPCWDGATKDANKTCFSFADPTGTNTINFQNFANGTVPLMEADETVSGTWHFTHPPVSDTACATDYTRVGTSKCVHSTNSNPSQITINSTCTTIDLNSQYGVPSTAKSVLLLIRLSETSGTVTGTPITYVEYYTDSGCSTILNDVVPKPEIAVYSAQTSAGRNIEEIDAGVNMYINGATTVYMKRLDTTITGSGHGASVQRVYSYEE